MTQRDALEPFVPTATDAEANPTLPSEQLSDGTKAEAKGRTPHRRRRPDTKQACLIALLRRKRGASIAELIEATGWQPHSVRGAISGTVRKKLGLNVVTEDAGKRGLVYRIPAEG